MTSVRTRPLEPLPNSLDRLVGFISDLVDPETHHVPAQLDQTLVPELVTPAELAIPASVITLSIHLDIELPAIG